MAVFCGPYSFCGPYQAPAILGPAIIFPCRLLIVAASRGTSGAAS